MHTMYIIFCKYTYVLYDITTLYRHITFLSKVYKLVSLICRATVYWHADNLLNYLFLIFRY